MSPQSDTGVEEESSISTVEPVAVPKTSANLPSALVSIATNNTYFKGDLSSVLRLITEAAADALEVERVSCWLFEDQNRRIRCLDLFERSPHRHTQEMVLEAADYPTYFAALEANRSIVAPMAQTDRLTREFRTGYLEPLGITSMLDASVRLDGKPVGVICHEHVGTPRTWSAEEQDFAGSIADFVALAMERLELRKTEETLRKTQLKYQELLTEKLRMADERYRALVEMAPNGILMIDRTGRISFANARAEEFSGLNRREIMKHRLDDPIWQLTDAENRPFPPGHSPLEETLRTKQPLRNLEVNITRTTGDRATLLVSTSPILDAAGDVSEIVVFAQDITEKKQAQDKMRLYRQIFLESPNAVSILDSEGRFIERNRAHATLTQFTDEDVAGRTPSLYMSAPPLPWILKEMSQKGRFDGEIAVTRKDGTKINVDLSAFPLRNDKGEVLCFAGILRDITDMVRAREALRESEEFFRQIAENIEEVFWMTDVQKTRMIYISPTYETIWGQTKDSLYKRPGAWFDAVHPEDRERVRNAVAKQAMGEFDEEYRILRPDGTTRWIRDRAFPVRDGAGNVYRIAGIAEDITELKNSEYDLRLLANISEKSVDAISTLGPDGKYASWNRAAENIFGYKAEEILGRDPWTTIVPLERLAETRALFEADPFSVVQVRTERLHKSGKRIPVMVTMFPLVDERGKLLGRAGIHQDLTQIAEMERRLMEQSRMAAIGSMAAGIAHEIRNPLFGISSVAQILSREIADKPQLAELANSMLEEIERLNKLLRNLLMYTRPSRLELEDARPKDLIEQVLTLNAENIKSQGIRVNREFKPEEAQVRVDPSQIRQVILNLCLNAVQASPLGSVIEIKSTVTGEKGWTFQIHNDGEPIDLRNLSRIFEPFFSTKREGSGLGLSVCKKLIVDHGGTIECASSREEGTTFTFTIPRL
ncbi:MAG: PAS domain S-box protein [Pseudomonadota bacterium]